MFSLFHKSAPVLAVSIVFFPLLDTARVFIIRIFIHKTSPFIADKNHIHHRFLKLGFSHIKTTTIVVAINALLVLFAFFIRPLDIHFQFGLVIFLGCFMYFIFYVFYLSLQKSSLKSDITVKSQS